MGLPLREKACIRYEWREEGKRWRGMKENRRGNGEDRREKSKGRGEKQSDWKGGKRWWRNREDIDREWKEKDGGKTEQIKME